MTTARDIMRGTFRLSIGVAGLAAAYAVYERSDAFEEAQNESLRMTLRLECGARRSEEDLRTAVNEFGLIDLAEIGSPANRSGHRSKNFGKHATAASDASGRR